jgi:hypothetical protein
MHTRIAIILILAFYGAIPVLGQATDTVQSQEISGPESASIQLIRSESLLRDRHFSDTSSYGVIYLYRPFTGTFPKNSIDIYAEDDKICSMENKGHYIFVVYGSRTLKLTGLFSRDTCHITVNIEPGKAYYLRCTMETGIFGQKHYLRNYKIHLDPMPAEKGKKQFDRTFKPRTFWS